MLGVTMPEGRVAGRLFPAATAALFGRGPYLGVRGVRAVRVRRGL